MRIAMRSALFISLSCCSLLLFSEDAEAGVCPGEESGLAKTVNWVGPYHGDGDYIPHSIERWADYPWNWPECYWEFEDASFDARDVTEQVGPSLEYANCDEADSTTTINVAGSVTISAQLSGSASIAGELGWKTSGTAKFGGSGSFSWQVNAAATGEASISDSDHAARTHYFWHPYVRWAYRKGAEYTYWQGTVRSWCDTHSQWGNSFPDQVDYYSDTVATAKYVEGVGIQARSCTPCPCTAPFTPQTIGHTSPPKISYTAGQAWFDD